MNFCVKILTSDDGEKRFNQRWHLVQNINGYATLCEGEYFGSGESGCEYKTKKVKRGGINCPNCIEIIKKIKRVRL